ncbi:hypothetical protein FEM48_Zijuj03G0133500 [Ziziphus jujuba var. spinosa]|uniref:Transcription factor DUO1-like n=1 Tax=Ziziphus jujuba var. spinosa TaxID=714518 RepID=A0A978VQJ2_ZIZJJ|nr:hypothetical protein FEM48_Zijuj03G0133500 [Ziziphus jujuba var. spinosa]
MERQSDGTFIKKGPWTAEEDEVLINHVNRNGPRDWSSIRSKGLLPRTGKSCRLRWVNKLRPNLKTGCKFSVEEERVVIELQAEFGNKWAKIATYLPGRTDNDVKNFWSTRRKRLERILHKPSPLKSQTTKGKNVVVHQLPKVPSCSSTIMEATPCHSFQPNYAYLDSEELRMVPLPDLEKPNLINLETDLHILEGTPIQRVASIDSSPYCPLSQPSQSQLDSSVLPQNQEINLEPTGSNLFDMFEQQEAPPESESGQEFFNRLPSLGFMGKTPTGLVESTSTETLNNFFEDFPPEMIDYLEALPSSSGL